jgi:hypothetical protein
MTMAETSMESATTYSNESQTRRNSGSSFETSRSVRRLTEESVRAFLFDYYDQLNALAGETNLTRNCWESFYEKNHGEDFVQIRPSGNPIDSHGLARLFASGGDVVLKAQVLVSVDSVILLANGRVAVVTYTADQSFSYKGVHNEDRAVFSSTIEEINGVHRMMHEHRSSGICIPKETRWSSTAALSSRRNSIDDLPCAPYSNASSSGMTITKDMSRSSNHSSNHSASSPIMDPPKRSVSSNLAGSLYSNANSSRPPITKEISSSSSHSA